VETGFQKNPYSAVDVGMTREQVSNIGPHGIKLSWAGHVSRGIVVF